MLASHPLRGVALTCRIVAVSARLTRTLISILANFAGRPAGIGRSAASNLRCGARFLPLLAEPTTAPKRPPAAERWRRKIV